MASTRLSKVEPRNITTYGRFNTLVKDKLTKFDITNLTKISSPNRMQAVAASDALVDPYQTQGKWRDPLTKRNPSHNEWLKRSTEVHDRQSKVIRDNQNRPIEKVDRTYGHRNGGLFMQSTFGRTPDAQLSQ